MSGPAGGSERILGFDIGGTKTAVVMGTTSGAVLERRSQASDVERGFDAQWASMMEMADDLVAAGGPPDLIGVSIGGPVDTRRGIVHSPPNLPGWDAVPVRDLLVARFGVPTYVQHDARAGALAERAFGAAMGCRDVVFLTVGTGLGAGLILDGRVHRGSNDIAGEVGHWRMARRGPRAYGKVASWEAFASGGGLPGLARYMYPRQGWPDAMTAEHLVAMARRNDPIAGRVVRTAAAWLGWGIALIVDMLDPEVVVLGSLAVRAGDLLLPEATRVARRESLRRDRSCRIVASGLGDRIGDLAALSAAIHGRDEGEQPAT